VSETRNQLHLWHVLEPFEQLAEKLLGSLLVAPALHQDIQHAIVLVNHAPQVMALAIDGQKDLAQVPFIPWLGTSTLQLICIVLPKLQTPLADGFMGDVDTASTEQLLHIAIAQGEALVEPDDMADDFAGKAVMLVVLGGSGWRHVWLFIGVFAWFLRVHHWSEYLTAQEARSTT